MSRNRSFDPPFNDTVADDSGLLARVWQAFMREMWERLNPLGIELSAELLNNRATSTNISGMKFDYRAVSQVIVEYLVQRITTGGGATDLCESGSFVCTYRPADVSWDLDMIFEAQPDDAGVAFFIGADGQVGYTTSNITGDASISRIVWRTRSLRAKHSSYSSMVTR